MMRRILLAALLVALALTSAGCGAIDNVTKNITGGDDNMKTVSELWSDVPRMDGLAPSEMEMPLFVKLAMRTVLGNLGRVNKEDKTTGDIDWIVFSSGKTPQEVQNFYTNARMAAAGWEASDKSTCLSGGTTGVPQVGVLCIFAKQQTDKQTQLVVIAGQDDQTKQTNIFFLRVEEMGTPTPR
jgi:hypothetical protein